MLHISPHKSAAKKPHRVGSKEVKILHFVLVSQAGSNVPQAEKLLTEYVNEGWYIVAAGGVSGDPGEPLHPWGNGFIVLQRDC
jgi:hypothetical protein